MSHAWLYNGIFNLSVTAHVLDSVATKTQVVHTNWILGAGPPALVLVKPHNVQGSSTVNTTLVVVDESSESSCTLQLGDGEEETFLVEETLWTATVSHTFENPGVFSAAFTCENPSGSRADTHVFTVAEIEVERVLLVADELEVNLTAVQEYSSDTMVYANGAQVPFTTRLFNIIVSQKKN